MKIKDLNYSVPGEQFNGTKDTLENNKYSAVDNISGSSEKNGKDLKIQTFSNQNGPDQNNSTSLENKKEGVSEKQGLAIAEVAEKKLPKEEKNKKGLPNEKSANNEPLTKEIPEIKIAAAELSKKKITKKKIPEEKNKKETTKRKAATAKLSEKKITKKKISEEKTVTEESFKVKTTKKKVPKVKITRDKVSKKEKIMPKASLWEKESPEDKSATNEPLIEETTTKETTGGKATTAELTEKKITKKKIPEEKTAAIEPSKKKKSKQELIVEKPLIKAEKVDIVKAVDKKTESETTVIKGVETEKKEVVDYSIFGKGELIKILDDLLDIQPVQKIRNDVENIKVIFYKKYKTETDKKKKKFISDGGELEDFKIEEDEYEVQLKELLKKYKNLKAEYNKQIEIEKQENLLAKYKIIEEIKHLVNRKESINQTFQDFRDSQKQWRSIGLVPQQNVKDLWETYHYHVEKFYDYIKINKELRDLDLKKNLEIKIKLCEKAEELLLEPSILNAFKTLQKYHNEWREIGPVTNETKVEIWERFKEATTIINKKHQEYYEKLKETQRKNLESKTLLCEKAEELSNLIIDSHKEWDKKTKEIIELQRIWKTIGYTPKNINNKIYLRFRNACDAFFAKKREFYEQNKEIQNNNLQFKTDLCIEAEALKESMEWKKTTVDLINFQKKWKEIGQVPRKYSDAIWKRFRVACDTFFDKKNKYYSTIDSKYEENLRLKQELTETIEKYELGDDIEENFEKLKEFQRKWTEIGYVPFKNKDDILQKYRNAINKHFDNFNIDETKKNLLKFKNKLENIHNNPKANQKLTLEREKFVNKLKQMENDIALWENNIGFFSKSKNAISLIDEVKAKIEQAKNNIELLKEKIRLIDNFDSE